MYRYPIFLTHINFIQKIPVNSDDILLVKIKAADVKALQKFSIATFHESFAWGNTEENMQAYMNEAFNEKQLLKELNDPCSIFYFAKQENKIVGYFKLNTGMSQSDLQDQNGLEVSRIYVKKEYQGKQIGKLMLDRTIAIAKEKKAGFVWLGVWEKNESAIRFYERHGFVKYSRHSFMVGNDRQMDHVMKLKYADYH